MKRLRAISMGLLADFNAIYWLLYRLANFLGHPVHSDQKVLTF